MRAKPSLVAVLGRARAKGDNDDDLSKRAAGSSIVETREADRDKRIVATGSVSDAVFFLSTF